MAKKEETTEDLGFSVDGDEVNDLPLQEVETPQITVTESYKKIEQDTVTQEDAISCLRNERIIIRHIPKETGIVSNPKHILYGGMA